MESQSNIKNILVIKPGQAPFPFFINPDSSKSEFIVSKGWQFWNAGGNEGLDIFLKNPPCSKIDAIVHVAEMKELLKEETMAYYRKMCDEHGLPTFPYVLAFRHRHPGREDVSEPDRGTIIKFFHQHFPKGYVLASSDPGGVAVMCMEPLLKMTESEYSGQRVGRLYS